jgi:clan AA aspartic protease (TIGR02281 family)
MGELNVRWWLGWVLALSLAIAVRADAQADATSSEGVFASRGLSLWGAWLVLPQEKGVHDEVGEVKKMADTVHRETTSRRDLRFELQSGRHNLETLVDSLVAADNQLNKLIYTRQHMSKDDTSYPALIEMYNEAGQHRDAITSQIDKQQKAIDDATTRLGQVPDSRVEYLNKVMDVATQAESMAKTYVGLAKDQDLAGAIAKVNADAHPPVKLGPGPAFASDLQFLRKAVKEIVDSPVPVQRGDDNEIHVQAMLNGTVPVEMIWDSGADLVLISADTAKQLGLKFTHHDRTIDMISADGSATKVKDVLLDSVRVGGFTVRNVECFVLPDTPGSHPLELLGDSFQTHFVSRMDQRSQQLQLTPIDSSVLVGAIPPGLQGGQ